MPVIRALLRLSFAFVLGAGMVTDACAEGTKILIGTGVDPAFAAFYVGKQAGIFNRNGLDASLNMGPSGSAMVSLLINNQIQAAIGAEQAGIQSFNLDSNVVVVAESTEVKNFYGVVSKAAGTMGDLKGKRIGVAMGSGSEVFWRAIVAQLKLGAQDYKVVPVDPPEMVAALERNDIDAFVAWEPWLTKAVRSVAGAKIVLDNEGIMTPRAYLYMNKSWIVNNPAAARAFVRSLLEANEMTRTRRSEAARYIADTLKIDVLLTETLMGKLVYEMQLTQVSVDHLKETADQIKEAGKLLKPVDWNGFIYADLLRSVEPMAVSLESK